MKRFNNALTSMGLWMVGPQPKWTEHVNYKAEGLKCADQINAQAARSPLEKVLVEGAGVGHTSQKESMGRNA